MEERQNHDAASHEHLHTLWNANDVIPPHNSDPARILSQVAAHGCHRHVHAAVAAAVMAQKCDRDEAMEPAIRGHKYIFTVTT